jgi:hypothetical protein
MDFSFFHHEKQSILSFFPKNLYGVLVIHISILFYLGLKTISLIFHTSRLEFAVFAPVLRAVTKPKKSAKNVWQSSGTGLSASQIDNWN